MFNELAAKHAAKHAKAPTAREKHLIPGAKPVSQAEFKVPFEPPPSWRALYTAPSMVVTERRPGWSP